MLLYDEVFERNRNNINSGIKAEIIVIDGLLKSSNEVFYYSSLAPTQQQVAPLDEFVSTLIDRINNGDVLVKYLPKLKSCKQFATTASKKSVSADEYYNIADSIWKFFVDVCKREERKPIVSGFYQYQIDKKFRVVVSRNMNGELQTFISRKTNYVHELVDERNIITNKYAFYLDADVIRALLNEYVAYRQNCRG